MIFRWKFSIKDLSHIRIVFFSRLNNISTSQKNGLVVVPRECGHCSDTLGILEIYRKYIKYTAITFLHNNRKKVIRVCTTLIVTDLSSIRIEFSSNLKNSSTSQNNVLVSVRGDCGLNSATLCFKSSTHVRGGYEFSNYCYGNSRL